MAKSKIIYEGIFEDCIHYDDENQRCKLFGPLDRLKKVCHTCPKYSKTLIQ